MLLTVLACAVGYLQKLPCRAGAWNTAASQYAYACYTDIYPLYFGEGLAQGQMPYVDHAVEYPVLMGAVMQATAWLVSPLRDLTASGRTFYDINVALLTLAAVVTVGATVAVAGRQRRGVAMVAAAPGLALAAYINWDLLAVALMALAVWAWARGRAVWAGVALGLAVAMKFYPVLLLGPLFLLCLRAGKLREFVRTFAATTVVWVAVNLPVYLVAPEGWATFYAFSQERGAGWGSSWLLFQRLGVPVLGSSRLETLNAVGTGAFLLLCASIAVLALAAPRRPRLAQLALLTVAAFVLTNKVWSPQYVLWLLPFAVLARPRWPALLAWQAAWVVYFAAIWYRLLDLVGSGAGLGESAYLAALALRGVAVLALCALVVWEVVRPARDLVRADGADDPAGGVLDGALDRVTLRPGALSRRPSNAAS